MGGGGTEIESCRLPLLLIFYRLGRRSIFDGSFVRQGSLAEKKSSKERVLSPKLPEKGKKCALIEQCGEKVRESDAERFGRKRKEEEALLIILQRGKELEGRKEGRERQKKIVVPKG